MFKDDFKKANDSIHADKELAEKILSHKPSKSRPEIYLRKYIPAAAAAVVVLSTSIAILPKMLDNSTDGVIYSTISTTEPSVPPYRAGAARSGEDYDRDEETVQTPAPAITEHKQSAEDNSETAAQSVPAVSADAPSAAAQNQESSAAQRSIAKAEVTAAPKASGSKDETVQAEAEQEIVSEESADTEYGSEPYESGAEHTADSGMEAYEFFADSAQGSGYSFSAPERQSEPVSAEPERNEVVLHINFGTELYPMAAERYLGGELYYGSLNYEDWTYADYFSYIGTDFEWDIPQDLSLTGHGEDICGEVINMAVDEYGVPAFDNMIFAYEGAGGRYLSVQTTRSANTAMNYLTDKNLVLSSVNGNDAVIIGNEQSWRCYMLFNGAAYTVTGDNITKEELGRLLCSITNSAEN